MISANPSSAACFARAAACEPKNDSLLFSIGRYWVWRARLLPEQPAGNTPSRQQGIDRFQRYFKDVEQTPESPAAPVEQAANPAPPPQSATRQFHTVKSGENLYRIGLRYGLTVEVLRRMNQMDEGDPIYPGQKLVVGTRK